jgi:hypothetical protein
VTLDDDPTLPPAPPGKGERLVTVRGVVTAGVEAGCLLLDHYLLVGAAAAGLRPGARVQVTGVERPGLLTTCQQGVPLEVRRVAPERDGP